MSASAKTRPRSPAPTGDPAALFALSHPVTGVVRAHILDAKTVRCGSIVVCERSPIYAMARELLIRGIAGSTLLQTYTKAGTPSLRGRVGRMALSTMTEEDRDGLRLRPYSGKKLRALRNS